VEKKEWNTLLTAAVAVINKSINRNTKYSPYYLMYGTNPHTPHININTSITAALDQHIERLVSNLASAHRQVAEQVKNTQRETEQKMASVKQSIKEEGMVWVKRQVRQTLEPRWVGPALVMKIENGGATIVVEGYGAVHRSHCKVFVGSN
jgi:hypothetical protein